MPLAGVGVLCRSRVMFSRGSPGRFRAKIVGALLVVSVGSVVGALFGGAAYVATLGNAFGIAAVWIGAVELHEVDKLLTGQGFWVRLGLAKVERSNSAQGGVAPASQGFMAAHFGAAPVTDFEKLQREVRDLSSRLDSQVSLLQASLARTREQADLSSIEQRESVKAAILGADPGWSYAAFILFFGGILSAGLSGEIAGGVMRCSAALFPGAPQ